MMGIALLAFATVWLAAVVAIAAFVARRVSVGAWRIPVGLVLAIALFPLPLIDDIIGGIQFRKLCEGNQSIYILPNAKGRSVYLADVPIQEVKGLLVRVTSTEWRYVDVNTNETVVRYNTLTAGRGFFRLGEAPLTFSPWCEPGGQVDPVKLTTDLGITQIQRSELKTRAKK